MSSFSDILFLLSLAPGACGFAQIRDVERTVPLLSVICTLGVCVFGVLYLLIIGELSVWLSLILTFTLSFDLLGELPLLSGL